jgi:hypothetical protein
MVFNLLSYYVFIQVVVNIFKINFSPLHCNWLETDIETKDSLNTQGFKCEYTEIAAFKQLLDELFSLIGVIFLLGPIRLFFKFKEGKTSMEKIKEDFEDSRGFIDNIAARNNQGREPAGLLPTTTRPS